MLALGGGPAWGLPVDPPVVSSATWWHALISALAWVVGSGGVRAEDGGGLRVVGKGTSSSSSSSDQLRSTLLCLPVVSPPMLTGPLKHEDLIGLSLLKDDSLAAGLFPRTFALVRALCPSTRSSPCPVLGEDSDDPSGLARCWR